MCSVVYFFFVSYVGFAVDRETLFQKLTLDDGVVFWNFVERINECSLRASRAMCQWSSKVRQTPKKKTSHILYTTITMESYKIKQEKCVQTKTLIIQFGK